MALRLYKSTSGPVVEIEGHSILLQDSWPELIQRPDLLSYLKSIKGGEIVNLVDLELSAPIHREEVWAAGVTYFRSKEARMEESRDAGGGDFYDKVYDAERPELFFKSTASRVIGPEGKVRIRKDSKWNVPEPEFTLWIFPNEEILGYTIGNDMSSRDIEGENPLYLPQAKSYNGSTALGPCLMLTSNPLDLSTRIHMQIFRGGEVAFTGDTQLDQLKRTFKELIQFLFREMSFPNGVFLMTGTGIVPPDEFTLRSGDTIHIHIDGIGSLINVVA